MPDRQVLVAAREAPPSPWRAPVRTSSTCLPVRARKSRNASKTALVVLVRPQIRREVEEVGCRVGAPAPRRWHLANARRGSRAAGSGLRRRRLAHRRLAPRSSVRAYSEIVTIAPAPSSGMRNARRRRSSDCGVEELRVILVLDVREEEDLLPQGKVDVLRRSDSCG